MALTATTTLARRIDSAEAALTLGMAAAARAAGDGDVLTWQPGGGAAVLGEPGSPFNKVIGVGFGPAPSGAEWAAIEQAHAARAARIQVECSTLADPSVAGALTARGYRLAGFENILARRLDEAPAPGAGAPALMGVGPAEDSAWTRTVLDGFLHPDTFDGPPSHESFDTAVLHRVYEAFGSVPGVERLLAAFDGVPAGGASVYLRDGIAVFCGAATRPAFRRRGVQSALLRARLALARDRGCDLAVVTTQPGSKSQENVQRTGFELIYSRAILVLEPDPGARSRAGQARGVPEEPASR